MKSHLLLAALMSLGCALAPRRLAPYSTPVWVRSHNASAVDVYLLCGSVNAQWLGQVGKKSSDAFEIPAGSAQRCPVGLNFFLVVGPVRPQRGHAVQLVVEKYAGLSEAYTAWYGP